MKNALLLFAFLFALGSCSKDDNAPWDVVTANFTSSRNVIELGEPLKFTNTTKTNTSQGATRYEWDFGNGERSTEEEPSITFSSPGTYLVVLKAYGSHDELSIASQKVVVGYRYVKSIQLSALSFQNSQGMPWGPTGPNIFVTMGPDSNPTQLITETTYSINQTRLPLFYLPTSMPGTGNWSQNVVLTPGPWKVALLNQPATGNPVQMAAFNLTIGTNPPENRDALGNGSYTVSGGGYSVVINTAVSGK